MAELELAPNEWRDLYAYLIARLEGARFAPVRVEIEAAAAAPVFQKGTAAELARISKSSRAEVGGTTIRNRSPQERFAAAIDVLYSRLIEIPAVAEAAAMGLDCPVDAVEFRPDFAEQDNVGRVVEQVLPLEALTASALELEQMAAILERLGAVRRSKER